MQGSNAIIVTEQMPRGGWEVALKSPHQEQPNPGMQITQSQAGVKVKTKIQWEEADPSGHGRHWVDGGPPLVGRNRNAKLAHASVFVWSAGFTFELAPTMTN